MADKNILNLTRPAIDKSKSGWKTGVTMPKQATFDAKLDYFVTLHTTFGDITVKLFPDVAPQHVTSFINLAELGFYDDVPFHRIIPGFMMQGGDPLGSGTGGPAYKMKAEFNAKPHVRGTLSAARTNDPNTAGSQFFICFKTSSFLDRQYTVFGEVASGLDVVDKFEKIGSESGRPSQTAKITSAEVFTKPK
jgi:cyclophilin family peptidyl-prolyl cis-trans isomerase